MARFDAVDPQERALWMPPGSVRALYTGAILGVALYRYALGYDVPQELALLAGGAVGAYFYQRNSNQTQQVQQATAARMQDAAQTIERTVGRTVERVAEVGRAVAINPIATNPIVDAADLLEPERERQRGEFVKVGPGSFVREAAAPAPLRAPMYNRHADEAAVPVAPL